MIGIVRIALSRPYTFIVTAILILIFGTVSALKTPTDILPNIGIPVIAAVWSYNGMSPDDMSGRVIYYYERSLSSQVNDIEHIESQSLFGYGVVKVFFQPNVNINAALAQVTAASQTVLKQLPAGITPPYVLAFNASSVPILQLALSSSKLSESDLFDEGQNFIRPQLATVQGAAIPSPYGGKVRQIQVDLDQHALQARGLSAADVAAALSVQNLITPVGTEKIGKFEWNVKLNDAPEAFEELNDLPIKKVNGTIVFMHDVAQVRDGSPPQTNVVHNNGAKAVLMTILKSGSVSTLDIISKTKALLPQIRASLPASLNLTAVGDQSVFVTSAVSGVLREMAIAATLTGLMILVFLGSWRSTLIITISIPLAILFAVTMLSVLGETINVMTLGGLALAVGILVDDATVTIENINYHLEQGKQVQTAILDGAAQIVVPATVSLLCICIVFVPMFGLGGVAGFLFRPLAEAVVFAMMGSYLLSRTLVPTLANYVLRPHDAHAHASTAHRPGFFKRFQLGFERRFEAVRQVYLSLLELALRNRIKLLIGFFVVIALSFGLAPFLGQDFFPAIESNQIKLHVRAQTGTRIETMSALCGRIEYAVRTMIPPSNLANIVDNIGMPVSGINIAYANSGGIGVLDGDILITLKNAVDTQYLKTLRENLPRIFPGTTFAFLPADIITQILNFGLPAPLDLQVVGNNLVENRKYADELLARVTHVPGIADPRIQQAFNEPQLDVRVDRPLASLVGVSEKDAASSMLTTLAGSIQTAPTFWLNPKTGVSYPIVVQTPQYNLDTLGNLRNTPLSASGGDGGAQLLGGLAHISPSWSDAVVSHYNVRPVIDIFATTQGRDLGAVAHDINQIVAETAHDVPRGSQVVLRGQVSTMTSAYAQLLTGLAFAIVLIYLLIVVNFQSWIDPFVIVMGLPSALAGIVWMLFLTRTTLSVPALTGAIMCMGVATANSILVISFARERMATGVSAYSAALEAGATRFRPVLMTALAMIIGMLPTALSAEQNAPLGRAVIGGLLFATFATLFLVPSLFSLAHRREVRRHELPPPGAHPAE
jgi:multidrug efflux pump subunit AcrB